MRNKSAGARVTATIRPTQPCRGAQPTRPLRRLYPEEYENPTRKEAYDLPIYRILKFPYFTKSPLLPILLFNRFAATFAMFPFGHFPSPRYQIAPLSNSIIRYFTDATNLPLYEFTIPVDLSFRPSPFSLFADFTGLHILLLYRFTIFAALARSAFLTFTFSPNRSIAKLTILTHFAIYHFADSHFPFVPFRRCRLWPLLSYHFTVSPRRHNADFTTLLLYIDYRPPPY